MMEFFFVLFTACTGTNVNGPGQCSVDTAPFWFNSNEQCEYFRENDLPSILYNNGLPNTLISVCLGVDLPVGDPA